jgi:hypothetical protein
MTAKYKNIKSHQKNAFLDKIFRFGLIYSFCTEMLLEFREICEFSEAKRKEKVAKRSDDFK